MVTKEAVMDALREVFDPEIPVNVVDLGLIYGVEIDGDTVKVQMTMTVPGCPMHGLMTSDARERISKLEGVKKTEVQLVWQPPWSPDKMSSAAKSLLGWK